jgi:hypothetical protein
VPAPASGPQRDRTAALFMPPCSSSERACVPFILWLAGWLAGGWAGGRAVGLAPAADGWKGRGSALDMPMHDDVYRSITGAPHETGLAESVKMGCIRDRALFELLESNPEEARHANQSKKLRPSHVCRTQRNPQSLTQARHCCSCPCRSARFARPSLRKSSKSRCAPISYSAAPIARAARLETIQYTSS